jgi:hypothetical protein
MRPILFAAAVIGAASVLASTDATAQFYPRPPIFGPGFYGPRLYAPWFYRPGLVHVRPVRKKPGYTKHAATKQVSTKQTSKKQAPTRQVRTEQFHTNHDSPMRSAATTGISAAPVSTTVIPLPDQDLLTPQPEFDCEFKTSSDDNAGDQSEPGPTRAQADPSADGGLRMKLDYERQCYRHAMVILQDRLRLLQVSVGETIKAAILGTTDTNAQQEHQ